MRAVTRYEKHYFENMQLGACESFIARYFFRIFASGYIGMFCAS
jgi:hypothetical protein